MREIGGWLRLAFIVALGIVAASWVEDGWIPGLGAVAAVLAGVVGLGLVLVLVRRAVREGLGPHDAGLAIAAVALLAVAARYAWLELLTTACAAVLVWISDRVVERLPEHLRARRARRQADALELERRDHERREAVDPHLPPL